MTTLMIDRVARRKCDARCYMAKRDHCVCVCGGLNHKAGKRQAMENLRKVFLPVLREQGVDLGKGIADELARNDPRQMELPG